MDVVSLVLKDAHTVYEIECNPENLNLIIFSFFILELKSNLRVKSSISRKRSEQGSMADRQTDARTDRWTYGQTDRWTHVQEEGNKWSKFARSEGFANVHQSFESK